MKGLALGSAIHLCLPDYENPAWQGARWIGWLMVILLAGLPSSLQLQTPRYQWSIWKKWSIFFPLIPLTFAGSKLYLILNTGDVLTQSFLLMNFHLCCAYGLWNPQSRSSILRAIQLLTAFTYGWAVIHKLNTLFLTQPGKL